MKIQKIILILILLFIFITKLSADDKNDTFIKSVSLILEKDGQLERETIWDLNKLLYNKDSSVKALKLLREIIVKKHGSEIAFGCHENIIEYFIYKKNYEIAKKESILLLENYKGKQWESNYAVSKIIEILNLQKKYKERIEFLLNLISSGLENTRRDDNQWNLEIGDSYIKINKPDVALDYYKKARTEDYNYRAECKINAVQICFKDDYSAIANLLIMGYDKNSGDSKASILIDLARECEEMGKVEKAKEFYGKVVKEYPNDRDPYANCSYAEYARKRLIWFSGDRSWIFKDLEKTVLDFETAVLSNNIESLRKYYDKVNLDICRYESEGTEISFEEFKKFLESEYPGKGNICFDRKLNKFYQNTAIVTNGWKKNNCILFYFNETEDGWEWAGILLGCPDYDLIPLE